VVGDTGRPVATKLIPLRGDAPNMSLLKTLWDVVTLPVKLVLLPFKILSFIVSLVVYTVVLLLLAAVVFLVVL
jgi:hypothetical protein